MVYIEIAAANKEDAGEWNDRKGSRKSVRIDRRRTNP